MRSALVRQGGGLEAFESSFTDCIRRASDFVIDPVTTGRTRLDEIDNVEKTFVGLKVEHFIRDVLDAPKGLRDLVIDGIDIDVKNTTRDTWMIPPETYREDGICLLVASDERLHQCWLGLIVAREEFLNADNRDGKRSVSRGAFENILWIFDGVQYPASSWTGLDMDRFRELRKISGGTRRACQFFRENIRIVVNREVIHALLFDQKDYMKRIRGNQGARDVLRAEGVAVLSGFYDQKIIRELGISPIGTDDFIAIAGNTPDEVALLMRHRLIDRGR